LLRWAAAYIEAAGTVTNRGEALARGKVVGQVRFGQLAVPIHLHRPIENHYPDVVAVEILQARRALYAELRVGVRSTRYELGFGTKGLIEGDIGGQIVLYYVVGAMARGEEDSGDIRVPVQTGRSTGPVSPSSAKSVTRAPT
jgi:hypothetical protein